jgi:hypothetical protein
MVNELRGTQKEMKSATVVPRINRIKEKGEEKEGLLLKSSTQDNYTFHEFHECASHWYVESD